MTIQATAMVGARITGFTLVQELDGENIIKFRFTDDQGGLHEVTVAADSDEITFPRLTFTDDEED